jgi:hypothetical protein
MISYRMPPGALTSLVNWDEGRGWARIAFLPQRNSGSSANSTPAWSTITTGRALSPTGSARLQQRIPRRGELRRQLTENTFCPQIMLKALAMGMVGIFFLLSFHFRDLHDRRL